MNDDIIYRFIRRHHQAQVQVDVAFGGAASPAGFLMLDPQLVIGKAMFSRKLGDANWQIAASELPIEV